MKDDSGPPILDYAKADGKPSLGVLVAGGGAVVCTVMGAISLLLLMDGAWKISGVFSALGLLLALMGLRHCETTGRRIFLWSVTAAAAVLFALALALRD